MLRLKPTKHIEYVTEQRPFSLIDNGELKFINSKGDDYIISEQFEDADLELSFNILLNSTIDTKVEISYLPKWDKHPKVLNISPPHLRKQHVRQLITESTIRNRLRFEILKAKYFEPNDDRIQSVDYDSVLKPASGSKSMGLMRCNVGEFVVTDYVRRAIEIDKDEARRYGFIPEVERVITSGVLLEQYVPDIVEQYRVIPFPDSEDYVYKRPMTMNSASVKVPKVEAGTVHQFQQWPLPEKVKRDLYLLAADLKLWGYAIDLYKTERGTWGIFEFSPEYGLRAATDELRTKVWKRRLNHFIRQRPSLKGHGKINLRAFAIKSLREQAQISTYALSSKLGISVLEYETKYEDIESDQFVEDGEKIFNLIRKLGGKADGCISFEDYCNKCSTNIDNTLNIRFKNITVKNAVKHLLDQEATN